MQKPNILFLLADDQRHRTIHALGNKEILTPNLDRLVHQAVPLPTPTSWEEPTARYVCPAGQCFLPGELCSILKMRDRIFLRSIQRWGRRSKTKAIAPAVSESGITARRAMPGALPAAGIFFRGDVGSLECAGLRLS